ncbi:hypothetical protein AAIH25_10145 [Arthrobacter crystallopoietes]|jgi:hypothetical protein|uniref:SCO4848 family membrane protein n=1 Tax=Micrococcaceae TaxID=1268 RepID=UPI0021C7203B|nr:hypothetical protein [Arthrobacter sp. Marseille-P9274]
MTMPAALAWILVFAGLWSLIAWAPILLAAWKDPRAKDENGALTRYFTNRFMLASTSMILGLATAVIGVRGLVG